MSVGNCFPEFRRMFSNQRVEHLSDGRRVGVTSPRSHRATAMVMLSALTMRSRAPLRVNSPMPDTLMSRSSGFCATWKTRCLVSIGVGRLHPQAVVRRYGEGAALGVYLESLSR